MPMAEFMSVTPRIEQALCDFVVRERRDLAAIDDALMAPADAVMAFVTEGGKRLRPTVAYWAFQGAGGVESAPVLNALGALELFQAFALIQDDVMDRSDMRRGKPSVHRQFATLHRDSGWADDADSFGDSVAVLLGDLCLMWSDKLLQTSGLAPDVLAGARGAFDRMREQAVAGQLLDLASQVSRHTSTDRARKVNAYKTSSGVEGSLLFGAGLAAAARPLREAYSAYGLLVGEAYQLRDDVHGVLGDSAKTGKPVGDDLRAGKRTYLVAAAFETAGERGRDVLRRRLGDPALGDEEIAEVIEVLTDSGALARVEARIRGLSEEAVDVLAAADCEPEARHALSWLASHAIHHEG